MDETPKPTPFLQIVVQRHSFDCGVACLAMLLGTDYETTLLAFRSFNPLIRGVSLRHMQKAAERLGFALRYRRSFTLAEDTGILSLSSPRWRTDHMVVLKEGMVFDTDATVWEVDVFLVAYEAKPLSLLMLVEKKCL